MIGDIIKYGIIVVGGIYALGQVSGKVDSGFEEVRRQILQLQDTVRESQQDEKSDIRNLSNRLDSVIDRPPSQLAPARNRDQ
jgi:hypothetical protein